MATKRKNIKKVTKSTKTYKKQHPKHFLKVYWPYIPIIAVVVFGMLFSGVNPRTNVNQPATLAYSTEMGIASLLSNTNSQRASNGLGALTLNSQLNSSAQAKANDMVAKDYWAHNSPNGDEPWVFFDAAGYNYQKAGENLAYGFSTSSATVVGWMNSPSHRANILDDSYTEVGFGFANSENFTGTGQETIVVAHYALPVAVAVPASTTAQSPVSQPKSATKPQSTLAETTTEETSAPVVDDPVVEEIPEPISEDRINQPITSDNPVSDDVQSTSITRLQSWTGGKAPWSALALSIVGFSVVVFWLVKHAILVKKFLLRGEQFAAHHPLLDLVVVMVTAIAVYLSQSSGIVL